MTHKNEVGYWLGAMGLVAGVMTAGCNAGTTTENATTAVSQAVAVASDSTDAVEVSSLMQGLHALRVEAVEGFHCDASPDITYVDVCGKSLPATVHLEWTNCAAPQRQGSGGGGMCGAPATGSTSSGSTTGTVPPPSSGSGHAGSMTPSGRSAGGAHPGDKDGGPSAGPSSGTVDLAYTYAAAADCSGAVTQTQAATFQISRTADDGSISKVAGSTSSTAQLVAGAPPQQKQTDADVTRTRTDAAGTVVSSVHLTGSTSVAFSSDTPPTRTLNGSYTEAFLDGTQGTVTLANIVRPPRSVCPSPTSGTLTRATSDGQSHTLVFGPDCGTATLDGNAVQLPDHSAPGK